MATLIPNPVLNSYGDNRVMAGEKHPLKVPESTVERIQRKSADVYDSAKEVKLAKEHLLPWQYDKDGKMLSTPVDQLRFKVNYLRKQLGLKTVTDVGLAHETETDLAKLSKRKKYSIQDSIISETVVSVNIKQALIQAACELMVKLESELAVVQAESKFRMGLMKWMLGDGQPEEYNNCWWVKDKESKKERRKLLTGNPNLTRGVIESNDMMAFKTKLFIERLFKTPPKNDEEHYLWYKYLVKGKKVDFDYIYEPSYVSEITNQMLLAQQGNYRSTSYAGTSRREPEVQSKENQRTMDFIKQMLDATGASFNGVPGSFALADRGDSINRIREEIEREENNFAPSAPPMEAERQEDEPLVNTRSFGETPVRAEVAKQPPVLTREGPDDVKFSKRLLKQLQTDREVFEAGLDDNISPTTLQSRVAIDLKAPKVIPEYNLEDDEHLIVGDQADDIPIGEAGDFFRSLAGTKSIEDEQKERQVEVQKYNEELKKAKLRKTAVDLNYQKDADRNYNEYLEQIEKSGAYNDQVKTLNNIIEQRNAKRQFSGVSAEKGHYYVTLSNSLLSQVPTNNTSELNRKAVMMGIYLANKDPLNLEDRTEKDADQIVSGLINSIRSDPDIQSADLDSYTDEALYDFMIHRYMQKMIFQEKKDRIRRRRERKTQKAKYAQRSKKIMGDARKEKETFNGLSV